MADFSTLIATLQATIKTNYNQEITGQVLQDDLLAMVNVINQLKQDTLAGYAFYGAPLANGASVAVTQNTFFLVGKGTYTINGVSETTGEGISALVYDSVDDDVHNYPLFVYDTTPTQNSKNAITSGAVHTALAPLATKAEVEAVEQEVAQVAGEAGLAEAVIDTDGAGMEQEFTFRKSGGDGGAYYRKIKGKTLAWNQLNANPAPASPTSVQASGVYSASVSLGGSEFLIPAGHTALLKALIKSSAGEDAKWKIFANSGSPTGGTEDVIVSSPTTSIQEIATLCSATTSAIINGLIINSAAFANDDTITVLGYNVFDLTQMFGAGNEPSTVAEFEALYPEAYYPYTPGTLISNDAEAVETTGVNQWDEEWEVGSLNNTNGENLADDNWIRSKNYIQVLPGEEYYVLIPSTCRICAYDSHKNYISTFVEGRPSGVQTIPANARYIRFGAYAVTTYNHDICINISNPAINGQYFPYWKRTLQLGLTTKKDTDGNVPFADGMKGAGTAADWCDKVGGEKRMVRVNLGDLDGGFIVSSENGTVQFSKPSGAKLGISPLLCEKFVYHANGGYNLSDEEISDTSSSPSIWIIRSSAFVNKTLPEIVALLSGVELVYELATPVPFTWAEPLNLGVKVDENGAERAVAPEGATAPSAPFVADTTYTMSVARMVEKLRNL